MNKKTKIWLIIAAFSKMSRGIFMFLRFFAICRLRWQQ